MKPLKLVISAFGAFANQCCIPFEELGKESVFLITGDTGAGKTTIFDALCFALYGKASGEVRDVRQFRSQYAQPSAETFAELEFLCGDIKYRVKRNPVYERKKKSGTGTTIQKADAELWNITGENPVLIMTGYNDVTEKISDITGIDDRQFRQIVMIAQGEFQKFLFSSSADKEKILRQLFHTHSCENFQKILTEKLSEIKEETSALEERILYALHSISPRNDDISEDYSRLIESEGAGVSAKLCDMLKKSCDEAEKNIPETENLIKTLREDADKLIQEIESGKKHNQNLAELEKNTKSLKSAETELETALDECGKAEKNAEILPKLNKEYTILEHTKPKYQELKELRKECQNLKTLLENQLAESKKSAENLEENQKKFEEISKYLETAGNRELELNEVLHTIENNVQQLKNLELLEEQFRICDKESDILKECGNNYEKAHKEYFDKIRPEYDRAERLFFGNMAGNLALKLENGKKCPVCGSTEHPEPAEISEECVTEKDFQKIQKKNQQKFQELHELKSVFEKQSERCEIMNRQKAEQLEKYGFSTNTAIQTIEETKFRLDAEIVIQKEKSEILRNQIQEDTKKREFISRYNESLPVLRREYDALCEKVHSTESTIAVKNAEVNQLAEELPYETFDMAQQRISALKSQIEKYTLQHKLAEENVLQKRNKITALMSKIEHLTNETGEKPFYNTSESENILKSKRKNLEKLQNELSELQHYCRNCRSITADIESMSENLMNKRKQYHLYEKLCAMVKGNYKGTERISFERFVQTYYFNQVIEHANQKLISLSNGRYCFVRRQEEQKHNFSSGLNLDVTDYYTGTVRNVETLSGGETFLASLSLALGLSDTVQSRSGGIKLDAMFIDEGFGSLDSSALDNAVRLLEQLSDNSRMIGIISHVSELSERFENQLTVKKGTNGSSVLYSINSKN